MKISPVGAELFNADGRTDGQTDSTNLIVAFPNFFKSSKYPKADYLNPGVTESS